MRSQLPNSPHKSCRERASSQPPKELPVTSDAEHHQAEDSSDSEFVLPALGGPDPHNKFDGMEWVDIKGMDDDKLQDISTDLRLYYKRMNGCWNALIPIGTLWDWGLSIPGGFLYKSMSEWLTKPCTWSCKSGGLIRLFLRAYRVFLFFF